MEEFDLTEYLLIINKSKIMVYLFTVVVLAGMIVLLAGIFKYRKFKGHFKLFDSSFGLEGEV